MSTKRISVKDEIGHFTTIPTSLIALWPHIGLDAIALFVYLRYCTNNKSKVAYPGYDTIRAHTSLTRQRIAKAIHKLEGVGALTRKKRFSNTTIYGLRAPSSRSPQERLRASSRSPQEHPVVPPRNANLDRVNLDREGESPPLLRSLEDAFSINLDGEGKNLSRALAKYKAHPEQVAVFCEWWYRDDWRGKRNEPPTAKQIAELWPQAFRRGNATTARKGRLVRRPHD